MFLASMRFPCCTPSNTRGRLFVHHLDSVQVPANGKRNHCGSTY